jgi:hypothetical protein
MADWGGKVAAWFTGVAAVSAALAALVAQTAKQPLHGRMRDLFIVLVVAAAVSFVVLLLTGPRALWAAWRNRGPAESARPIGLAEPDPADWIAGCDETEDHLLLFTLRHRFENPGAIMALGEKRCTVTDPAGVTTAATGTQLFYQYVPHFFPGAPHVRSGVYRFTWEGRDAKGAWHEITRGSYEVQLPSLMVRLKEPPQWENWKCVAMIAAFHVQITNMTDRAILIAFFGFTTDNRGLQPWTFTATNEERAASTGRLAPGWNGVTTA